MINETAEQFLNEEPEADTSVQLSCFSPIKNAFKSMTVRPAKRVEFNSSQSSLSSTHGKLLKDGIKQDDCSCFFYRFWSRVNTGNDGKHEDLKNKKYHPSKTETNSFYKCMYFSHK
ncbi:uncharacterized protein LOC124438808 [Xenia sp. Carnegie-2017]|uniref:uncharacterized protein LOC124438808 n=1 Tax=Xenia sp. Carnegie-2017 TaxID=2897299 RepID=UPI001F03FD23|nr:uncharacterized protein LOC124438808 [Xenia sp. Carnegie-2017]